MAHSTNTIKPFGYIYLVRNMVNGKIYIGQTIHPVSIRWKQHVQASRSSRRSMVLNSSIRKYGKQSFCVYEIDRSGSQDELNILEKKHIETYGARDADLGYNIREGGWKGTMSEVSKGKISASLIGNKRSAGKVPHNKGKRMDADQYEKVCTNLREIAVFATGKKRPAAIGEKISASKKGIRPFEMTEAIGNNMQNGQRARWDGMTLEQRKVHGAEALGKTRPPEIGRKISAALTGKRRRAWTEDEKLEISKRMKAVRAAQRSARNSPQAS